MLRLQLLIACVIAMIALITPAGVAAAETQSKQPLVTNVWVDAEIRQALQDISAQTGVTVLADQTVQGIISMAVDNLPLEDTLGRICAAGGLQFLQMDGYYLVGRAEPGTALFERLAEPHRLKLTYATCDQVKDMLHTSLARYVTYNQTEGSVLITAPPRVRDSVAEAIKLIDHPSMQIAIEAVVFELSEDGSRQLGLDWQYQDGNVAANLSNLVGTITFSPSSNLATQVTSTLRAIIAQRKGRVLANPRIVVMNGMEADIFVGQEKYFSLLAGQAINPYYRLESIKAGVSLNVLPRIGDNGEVTLQFEPEVSDVVTENNRDQMMNGNGDNQLSINANLPVVTRRRAKTVVRIKDGHTVLIGGLLQEQTRHRTEKVPLLGDLPLAGAAFRNVNTSKEQKEVLILINAHIVKDKGDAPEESRLHDRYTSPLDLIR